MPSAAPVNPLVSLAQSRAPADRERLLAKLADLCESRARPLPPRPAAEVEAVLLALIGEAEKGVRARFAERIARAAWPPAKLVAALVRDDVEIGRPLIAASPQLDDEALIALAVDGEPAHRLEIAHRPLISADVVAALVARDEPATLVALAGNSSAYIDDLSMRRLTSRATEWPALAAAMAANPRLAPEDPAQLEPLLPFDEGTSLADRSGSGAPIPESGGAEDDAAAAHTQVRPEPSEIKLVEKLAAAGQLRPGYLVRVLKEGRLGLFAAALAKLGGFPIEGVIQAINDPDRPELLALACTSVGVDRSVFPTLLQMVRRSNGGRPGGGEDSARRAADAFGPFTPELAASAFRIALGGV